MYLFDLDGTLIDSNGVWMQLDLDFLAKRGLVPTEDYLQHVSTTIFPEAAAFTKEYYRLPEHPEDIMEEWMSMATEAYAARIPLKPGAKAYLEQCTARGIPVCLVTASVPDLCRLAVARHGLGHHFTHIFYTQNYGLDKRDPQVFLMAAQRLSVPVRGCTLYDDSPTACAAAKSAGMAVVGVHDPFFAAWEDEMRLTCHRYIKSFEELL